MTGPSVEGSPWFGDSGVASSVVFPAAEARNDAIVIAAASRKGIKRNVITCLAISMSIFLVPPHEG
jgi:hypothetical protein